MSDNIRLQYDARKLRGRPYTTWRGCFGRRGMKKVHDFTPPVYNRGHTLT